MPRLESLCRGDFGPDVQYLISALDQVLGRYNVNRKQMTLAGFSDGATYALSLGLVGDIFSRVIAYSPGGFVPPQPEVCKDGLVVLLGHLGFNCVCIGRSLVEGC